MHPLLLALALGQAGPSAPQAPPEPAAAADHAPAPPASPASPAISPPPAAAAALAAPPPRTVELIRNADGTFLATLDGEPVRGADFYRAVLRPDLAARTEEARFQRTALLVAAGAAPLVGVGIGWVAGTAQQWPLPPCTGAPPGPVDCTAQDQVAAQNRSAMNTALLAGSLAGLVSGGLLLWAGTSIRPHQPSADEAEALVQAYRARTASPPAPASAPPPPASAASGEGASLRLEAGPLGARLAFRLGF